MFIGTILTGLYFPAKHRFHMLSTIIISLGFPLGYLILNPLTEYLFQTHEWHYVKRIYSCIALICLIVFSTFFTDKYVTTSTEESEETLLINQEETEIQQLYPSVQYQFLTNIVWLLGLFSFALAINALVLNLNGYFVSVGISPVDSTHLMMVLGATDALYRLLLSLLGYFFNNLLVNFYIGSALIGLILSLFWSSVTAYNLNFAMISGKVTNYASIFCYFNINFSSRIWTLLCCFYESTIRGFYRTKWSVSNKNHIYIKRNG